MFNEKSYELRTNEMLLQRSIYQESLKSVASFDRAVASIRQWANCHLRLLLCLSHSPVTLCGLASMYSSKFILSSHNDVCTHTVVDLFYCILYLQGRSVR